ncbi:MAG: hypothetical protein HC837_19965, partial [Chloroflexaceae bacterium]|nr:hypothetical protein [Chloroflexaceae bacterium]
MSFSGFPPEPDNPSPGSQPNWKLIAAGVSVLVGLVLIGFTMVNAFNQQNNNVPPTTVVVNESPEPLTTPTQIALLEATPSMVVVTPTMEVIDEPTDAAIAEQDALATEQAALAATSEAAYLPPPEDVPTEVIPTVAAEPTSLPPLPGFEEPSPTLPVDEATATSSTLPEVTDEPTAAQATDTATPGVNNTPNKHENTPRSRPPRLVRPRLNWTLSSRARA